MSSSLRTMSRSFREISGVSVPVTSGAGAPELLSRRRKRISSSSILSASRGGIALPEPDPSPAKILARLVLSPSETSVTPASEMLALRMHIPFPFRKPLREKVATEYEALTTVSATVPSANAEGCLSMMARSLIDSALNGRRWILEKFRSASMLFSRAAVTCLATKVWTGAVWSRIHNRNSRAAADAAIFPAILIMLPADIA